MRSITEVLAEKRAEILKLQEEVAVLEKAATLLTPADVREVRATAIGVATSHGYATPTMMPGPPLSGRPKAESAKELSVVELAEEILRKGGVPLHVNVILDQAKDHGREIAKMTLVSSLSKLVREGKRFYRPQPNVFGLIEWERAKEGVTAATA